MKLYMIDQENVGGAGLQGMSTLSSEDRVIIFCNHLMKSIPFATHIEIVNSKALVEYKVIERSGPNYLDFQLVTYLGYLIAQTKYEEIIIVSKDKGYEAAVDFWREKGIRIHRQSNIAEEAKSEEARKAPVRKSKTKKPVVKKEPVVLENKDIKNLLKGKVQLAPAHYRQIYTAFHESGSKMEFHERLCKTLEQDRGNEVYKVLKDAFVQALPVA